MATLSSAIALLNARPENAGNFAARIVRDATVPADYLLNTYLPEENRETYSVDAGAMSIYPTMAGLSGMDSAYAPVGAVKATQFLEETAKLTAIFPLPEKTQREMQAMIQRLRAQNADPVPATVQELIGFTQLLNVAHWTRAEFLRGQALSTGALSWTFNGKALTVDYGVPAGNKPSTRTGNDAYDKSTSKFWADLRAAWRVVGRGADVLMNDATFYGIVDNDANAIRVQEVGGEMVTGNSRVQRYRLTKRIGDSLNASDDVRDTVTVTVYNREGSVLTADGTQAVQFWPDGKIALIGASNRDVFRPGRGSAPDLQNPGALGYYHIAPTVEGQGQPGRWARVYVPDGEEYTVVAKSASNELPVIESPDKLYILSTEIGGS